jgi:heme/copper-type cytochrome/quinol oxidase subunit 2
VAAAAVAAAAAAALAGPARPARAQAREGRVVEVEVSRRGFAPSEITLRKGETAHLVLSAGSGEHCFAIDALRVEKRVVAGRATRFDLTPDRTGVFPFYCCVERGEAAEAERGRLTVTE